MFVLSTIRQDASKSQENRSAFCLSPVFFKQQRRRKNCSPPEENAPFCLQIRNAHSPSRWKDTTATVGLTVVRRQQTEWRLHLRKLPPHVHIFMCCCLITANSRLKLPAALTGPLHSRAPETGYRLTVQYACR